MRKRRISTIWPRTAMPANNPADGLNSKPIKKALRNNQSAFFIGGRNYFFTPKMASFAALATRNFTSFFALI
jgi:hypothetical protein